MAKFIKKTLFILEDTPNIPIILVGNKCDEENTREVSQDYVKEIMAKQMKNCGFMETSAKTNCNVKEAFQVCTRT